MAKEPDLTDEQMIEYVAQLEEMLPKTWGFVLKAISGRLRGLSKKAKRSRSYMQDYMRSYRAGERRRGASKPRRAAKAGKQQKDAQEPPQRKRRKGVGDVPIAQPLHREIRF